MAAVVKLIAVLVAAIMPLEIFASADTASIVAFNVEGEQLVHEYFELPSGPESGKSAEEAMNELYEAGKLKWTRAYLGPQRIPVVMSIMDVKSNWPVTGWILSLKRADGSVRPNVGIADIKQLAAGDVLEWKLMPIAKAPTPLPEDSKPKNVRKPQPVPAYEQEDEEL